MRDQLEFFEPDHDIPWEAPKTGKQLRDAGMEKASAHCDDAVPGWSEAALVMVKRYAERTESFTGGPFTSSDGTFTKKDIEDYAEWQGLPKPASVNGWGGVISRAAKSGIIRKVGVGKSPTPSRHSGYVAIWKSGLHPSGKGL